MKYLLLVSHGDFSSGLKQTLGMFAGDDAIGSVIAVGLKPDEAASTFGTRFEALLKTLPEDASFVVLADIVGGSPLTTVCNILNSALKEKAFSEATAAIKEFQTTSSEASDDDDI